MCWIMRGPVQYFENSRFDLAANTHQTFECGMSVVISVKQVLFEGGKIGGSSGVDSRSDFGPLDNYLKNMVKRDR